MNFTDEQAAELLASLDPPAARAVRKPTVLEVATPSPRNLDVFMSRAELARAASLPTGKVFRAFADGELTPDALDTHGAPLFLICRLAMLKEVLEKGNAPTLCE